ncbi:hypothetical protein ACFQS7_19620 [Dankookia sp. GCM10030260]|uniref:hypothetical protein n=1 Tax=Dankookia sp. GCM10030260 TaxID=3273390 RepID=UPI0036187735
MPGGGGLTWQGGVVDLGGTPAGGLLGLSAGDRLARFMAIDPGVIDRRRAGT